MPHTYSEAEEKDRKLFLETFKGIPTDVVAYALSRHSPGINFVGVSKKDMAEDWALSSYRGRGSRPKLNIVLEAANQIVVNRADARKRKADSDAWWRTEREKEFQAEMKKAEERKNDARDAARYRYVRENCTTSTAEQLDAEIDAALKKEKPVSP